MNGIARHSRAASDIRTGLIETSAEGCTGRARQVDVALPEEELLDQGKREQQLKRSFKSPCLARRLPIGRLARRGADCNSGFCNYVKQLPRVAKRRQLTLGGRVPPGAAKDCKTAYCPLHRELFMPLNPAEELADPSSSPARCK